MENYDDVHAASQFDEETIQGWMKEVIESADTDDSAVVVDRVEIFEDVGMLTHDMGLVLRLDNGQKVHITIQVY